MKNFDTDPNTTRGRRLADRDFTICGLPFRLRPSRDVPSDAIEEWRAVWSQMLDPDQPPVMDADFLAAFYAFMGNVLEPGQFDAFREVCQPGGADEPIAMEDAVDLINWATGVVALRPIGASSASSNGSTAPTTEPDPSSSTEPSSSPVPAGSTI